MKLSKLPNSLALPSTTILPAEKKNFVQNWCIGAYSGQHQLKIPDKQFWTQRCESLLVQVFQQLPWKTLPPKPVSHVAHSYGTSIVRTSCSRPSSNTMVHIPCCVRSSNPLNKTCATASH